MQLPDGDTPMESLPRAPLRLEGIETAWYQMSPLRFGSVYRAALEASGRVDVLLQANLVEIRTNPEASRVEFAEVAGPAGRFRVRARRLVLAAGGLENARLLLASDGVQAAGLGNGGGTRGPLLHRSPLSAGRTRAGAAARRAGSAASLHRDRSRRANACSLLRCLHPHGVPAARARAPESAVRAPTLRSGRDRGTRYRRAWAPSPRSWRASPRLRSPCWREWRWRASCSRSRRTGSS